MESKYDRIKNECHSRNTLWEDPDFPAVQKSVFYYQTPPFNFQWRRVTEIVDSPHASFISEGENFDIIPGRLGDCWLVSCFAVLRSLSNLFYRVVPADQSLEGSDGIFRFRIWWCGEWIEVLIDDRLPTLNGRLVFLQPHTSNCYWASLLEKAIAKLHGSYEALKYGNRADGLSDLLGGVVQSISIKGTSTTDMVRPQQISKYLESTCVITCIALPPDTTVAQHKNVLERLPNAITLNVNYRLCSLAKVETLLGDSVQLVRIQNTLGSIAYTSNKDYEGDWSPTSKAWERVAVQERDRLLDELGVGEFWMSFFDFSKVFSNLEIIYLDDNTAKDEVTLRDRPGRWYIKMFDGQWKRGVTAGGCRNHESFHINPQLLLTIYGKQELVVGLNQHTAVEPKVIGFTMYKLNGASTSRGIQKITACLPKDFFKTNVSFLNSDYGNTRHVTCHCNLDIGQYILVPTTYEPGEESSFTIRMFSMISIGLSLLKTQTLMLLDPFPALRDDIDVSKIKYMSQYEAVFMQLADENKTINCFELHELLDVCLPNDYIKGCANIDICRQVISLQDKTGSGRINFLQFKTFMVNLRSWQGVFKIYTKEKIGILRAERLQDALYDVGFQLSTEIMTCVMHRFIRKDGTLRLSDFASAILHLTAAFKYFQRRDHNRDNIIEISMSDWIKCVLRC